MSGGDLFCASASVPEALYKPSYAERSGLFARACVYDLCSRGGSVSELEAEMMGSWPHQGYVATGSVQAHDDHIQDRSFTQLAFVPSQGSPVCYLHASLFLAGDPYVRGEPTARPCESKHHSQRVQACRTGRHSSCAKLSSGLWQLKLGRRGAPACPKREGCWTTLYP